MYSYVQNALGKNVFKEVLKYTKKLNFTKCLKVESNRENLVFRGETNFHVNFGMSGDCPISGDITRTRLIGSGIFWNTYPKKRPNPDSKSPISDFFFLLVFLGLTLSGTEKDGQIGQPLCRLGKIQ